jgi:hypothetical protein
MRKFNILLSVAIVSVGFFAGCKDDDPDDGPSGTEQKIEELALTPQWNNYLVAATSELLDDCISLWAAWNGPEGVPEADLERIGADFFTVHTANIGEGGFAEIIRSAGAQGNLYRSQAAAIRVILEDGCANIANEVGEQKIGGPNGKAKAGDRNAVLEVESWYSWNSITDYSDNIISVRNSYFGSRDGNASFSSISAFVKSRDAELDTKVIAAIDRAYAAIFSEMVTPFRNNLIGEPVDEAIAACLELRDIFDDVYKLLENPEYDFTGVLAGYAGQVVVPTYKDMKDAAWKLHNAALAYRAAPTQAGFGKICEAWRENRIPWERSEAFLFGPADLLGLDPSLDSWPLNQTDILSILEDPSLTSVDRIKNAITDTSVRGFHTIELLLFKDGENRAVPEQ